MAITWLKMNNEELGWKRGDKVGEGDIITESPHCHFHGLRGRNRDGESYPPLGLHARQSVHRQFKFPFPLSIDNQLSRPGDHESRCQKVLI